MNVRAIAAAPTESSECGAAAAVDGIHPRNFEKGGASFERTSRSKSTAELDACENRNLDSTAVRHRRTNGFVLDSPADLRGDAHRKPSFAIAHERTELVEIRCAEYERFV